MRILLRLVVDGLIWEENACWQIKEQPGRGVKMQNYQTRLVF